MILALFCAFGSSQASAQTSGGASRRQPQPQRPTVALPAENVTTLAARERELTCAGFIEQSPATNRFEIVGAEEEQEQRVFSEGDYLFINAGAQEGIKVGQEFSVVRPRGQFKSVFTNKKGSLGVFTQDIGRIRVTKVQERLSIATVVRSCDDMLFGDLLRPVQHSVSPPNRTENVLERFTDPSGKQNGRIVLARDQRELLTRDQVVYIDLGAEDQIKPGDYLTIYRPTGTGDLTLVNIEETTQGANRGFESARFKGGKFSNKAQRVKNPQGGTFDRTVSTPEIKRRRPAVPRKVVGELVILGVEGRTASAVITRVAQEVHTGDFVELQ
ncbi:MAG TPA: FlgT C-terminal domain-containing protein [Pyrinomonadaceae bacterium]|nr:FlgT C-terminal domain-containing protein [Pyrinomonadaceae bacterium]